jgi:ankyrin repeat protein
LNIAPLFSKLFVALTLSSSAFASAIHDAFALGDLEKIKALLRDNPALISSRDNAAETPLHIAALTGRND